MKNKSSTILFLGMCVNKSYMPLKVYANNSTNIKIALSNNTINACLLVQWSEHFHEVEY